MFRDMAKAIADIGVGVATAAAETVTGGPYCRCGGSVSSTGYRKHPLQCDSCGINYGGRNSKPHTRRPR